MGLFRKRKAQWVLIKLHYCIFLAFLDAKSSLALWYTICPATTWLILLNSAEMCLYNSSVYSLWITLWMNCGLFGSISSVTVFSHFANFAKTCILQMHHVAPLQHATLWGCPCSIAMAYFCTESKAILKLHSPCLWVFMSPVCAWWLKQRSQTELTCTVVLPVTHKSSPRDTPTKAWLPVTWLCKCM